MAWDAAGVGRFPPWHRWLSLNHMAERAKKTSKSYRILVADDEPSVCRAYQMMLQHCGHGVQTVNGGAAALDLLAAESFDLVITDYLMPDMKGDELVAEIKRRQPDRRVIMVTAFADDIVAYGRPTGGADFILSKPFRMDEIRDAIAKVMT
jgi:CheY-like chemotaxis protein